MSREACTLRTVHVADSFAGLISGRLFAFSVVVCRARSYKRWGQGERNQVWVRRPPSEPAPAPASSRALGQYAQTPSRLGPELADVEPSSRSGVRSPARADLVQEVLLDARRERRRHESRAGACRRSRCSASAPCPRSARQCSRPPPSPSTRSCSLCLGRPTGTGVYRKGVAMRTPTANASGRSGCTAACRPAPDRADRRRPGNPLPWSPIRQDTPRKAGMNIRKLGRQAVGASGRESPRELPRCLVVLRQRHQRE